LVEDTKTLVAGTEFLLITVKKWLFNCCNQISVYCCSFLGL
jgi:hypothetical protein